MFPIEDYDQHLITENPHTGPNCVSKWFSEKNTVNVVYL